MFSKQVALRQKLHYAWAWTDMVTGSLTKNTVSLECEDETTDTLTQFWILFNEVLQKVSEDISKRFNPFGWLADEAGANWAAIANVFGREVLPHNQVSVSFQTKCQSAC